MTIHRALVWWTAGVLLLFGVAPAAIHALPIQVVYDDGADQGFLDPTLGPQRRAAFQAAVDQWAATLGGTVPVLIAANMLPLGGTGSAALLASTGAVTLHRNFAGGQAGTWYAAALANQLAGTDVNGPTLAEIGTTFNADVDGPSVLGSVQWYYGLDGQAGADIDFLTIALHEIGHGLGFLDTIDPTAGTFQLGDEPSILERMLTRPEIGVLSDLLPAERLAAIVAPGDLWWSGPAVVAFNGSPRSVYTPDPFQRGSSVAHWNTDPPTELMAPYYTAPNHEFGALLPALVDMGWEIAGATPTPRSAPATPTETRPPQPSPTPATPHATREMLYVANFDDATVSVIDTETRTVLQTLAVDDGPLGIAASPDGTRVYVAGFRAGTISVLRTGDNRVVASKPVGDSPNSIAVTPDGAFLAVTDTEADQVAIIAADTLEVVAQVPGGQQPSGLALDGTGRRAFVTDFNGATITVVDFDARRRRAIIPISYATASDGLLAIALAPATGRGYVAAFYGTYARPLFADTLEATIFVYPWTAVVRPEAVVTDAAGSTAYFVGHADTGAGTVSVVRMEDDTSLGTIPVGLVPEALALATDERLLYVANTGANTLSIVDPTPRRVVGTVPVGHAPMGVVAVAVPEGQCLDECGTPAGTTSATVTPIPTTTATFGSMPTPIVCTGDCNGDGQVSISELITGTTIALGTSNISSCPAFDCHATGVVTIDCLTQAVDAALGKCP